MLRSRACSAQLSVYDLYCTALGTHDYARYHGSVHGEGNITFSPKFDGLVVASGTMLRRRLRTNEVCRPSARDGSSASHPKLLANIPSKTRHLVRRLYTRNIRIIFNLFILPLFVVPFDCRRRCRAPEASDSLQARLTTPRRNFKVIE